ncbi:hypothetical protein MTP99_000457 [Tenebrio molitor]|nr:hypothetical protein MTP99_000457 [Tenebrio molitor]
MIVGSSLDHEDRIFPDPIKFQSPRCKTTTIGVFSSRYHNISFNEQRPPISYQMLDCIIHFPSLGTEKAQTHSSR